MTNPSPLVAFVGVQRVTDAEVRRTFAAVLGACQGSWKSSWGSALSALQHRPSVWK
jgi:hypothetical protein